MLEIKVIVITKAFGVNPSFYNISEACDCVAGTKDGLETVKHVLWSSKYRDQGKEGLYRQFYSGET